MLGWVIGLLVIGLTVWIMVRAVVRMVKGKGGCAGCGHSADCPRCRAGGLFAQDENKGQNAK